MWVLVALCQEPGTKTKYISRYTTVGHKALDDRLRPWIAGLCKGFKEWVMWSDVCFRNISLYVLGKMGIGMCVQSGSNGLVSVEWGLHQWCTFHPSSEVGLGPYIWPGPKPNSHSIYPAKTKVKAARLRVVAWGRLRGSLFSRVACSITPCPTKVLVLWWSLSGFRADMDFRQSLTGFSQGH